MNDPAMKKEKYTLESSAIGFVVIGRNEGDRLKNCLRSIAEGCQWLGNTHPTQLIVYVDSGSTDGSVEFARAFGCDVICLDIDVPFTAARARNAGFRRLLRKRPSIEYIQFIDGDCTLDKTWLKAGLEFIGTRSNVAIVCGRRREIHPEKSIYNLLCDMEWDTPIGQCGACGGDFLARRDALESVDGFCAELIAGEEPEMCYRLTHRGWKIWRIDREMTAHDAAIYKFRQFWLRSKRSGHAYVERSTMHATTKSPYCVRPVISILIWGGILPLMTIFACAVNLKLGLIFLAGYIFLGAKITLTIYRKYKNMPAAFYYGFLTTIGKFAQFSGVLQFLIRRFQRSEARLIEYK